MTNDPPGDVENDLDLTDVEVLADEEVSPRRAFIDAPQTDGGVPL